MKEFARTGFEFRPRPSKDDLSESIHAGWGYYEDFQDPLEQSNRFYGMQDSDRSGVRARDRIFRDGLGAAYVLGVGIVYDISHDLDGNMLFLTNTDEVQLRPDNLQ